MIEFSDCEGVRSDGVALFFVFRWGHKYFTLQRSIFVVVYVHLLVFLQPADTDGSLYHKCKSTGITLIKFGSV